MPSPGSFTMPRLITRQEALDEIRQRGGAYDCLMCALQAGRFGPPVTLYRDERALVMLPQYVRRWGHVLLILRQHVTSFSSVREDDWAHLNRLALRAARGPAPLLRRLDRVKWRRADPDLRAPAPACDPPVRDRRPTGERVQLGR